MRYEPGDRVQYVHPTHKHHASEDGTIPVYGTVDSRLDNPHYVRRTDRVPVTWDKPHYLFPNEPNRTGERPEYLRLLQPGDDGFHKPQQPKSKVERIREELNRWSEYGNGWKMVATIEAILNEEGDL